MSKALKISKTAFLITLLYLLFFVSCTSPGSTQSNSTDSSGAIDSADSTNSADSDDASNNASDEADSTDASTKPLIGFWGLNGYKTASGLLDIKTRFGSTVFQTASSNPVYTVNIFLPMVRAAGMKVTLRLTDDHDAYTTAGNFDLAKWKAQVALWEDSGVQEFIDDGTLFGHMLLDDIQNFSGLDPTAAELDEMARYSHEILPNLMAFVRCQASKMPVPASGHYDHVDAIVNQYKANEGPVNTYVTTEVQKAADLGVAVINGMNICDGGDGSSGQPGWRSGKFAMTAEEITTYGTALLDVPNLVMFLMWEYDGEEQWSDASIGSDYFDQSELQSALKGLSELGE